MTFTVNQNFALKCKTTGKNIALLWTAKGIAFILPNAPDASLTEASVLCSYLFISTYVSPSKARNQVLYTQRHTVRDDYIRVHFQYIFSQMEIFAPTLEPAKHKH